VDVGDDDAAPPSPSSSSPLELDEKDDRGLASSLFLRLRVHCTCALSLDGGADGDRDGMVWLLRSLGRMLCTKLAGLEESSLLDDSDLVNLVLAAAPLLL
jgi:hypothetical protein